MTNGEKIKEIFPYLESDETDLVKVINIDNLKNWWNAEYKEPTTKNDLGVDCISRIETIDYLCKHCPDDGECFEDCDEIKHLRQMSSVTSQFSSGLEKNSKELEKDFGESDCISRADVKRAIEDALQSDNCDYDLRDFLDDLVDIPSVTPQEPRWIPVSERMPEEQGLYLVTIKSGDKYYIDTDLYNTLYKKGFRTPNVVAWMPLPQPYREVEE